MRDTGWLLYDGCCGVLGALYKGFDHVLGGRDTAFHLSACVQDAKRLRSELQSGPILQGVY